MVDISADVDSADVDCDMAADIILAHFWKSHPDITCITGNKSNFDPTPKQIGFLILLEVLTVQFGIPFDKHTEVHLN